MGRTVPPPANPVPLRVAVKPKRTLSALQAAPSPAQHRAGLRVTGTYRRPWASRGVCAAPASQSPPLEATLASARQPLGRMVSGCEMRSESRDSPGVKGHGENAPCPLSWLQRPSRPRLLPPDGRPREHTRQSLNPTMGKQLEKSDWGQLAGPPTDVHLGKEKAGGGMAQVCRRRSQPPGAA